MKMWPIVIVFLLILPGYLSSNEIVELKMLRTQCKNRNGLICTCELTLMPYEEEQPKIALRNCSRIGGWSGWSEWSSCHENKEIRQRQCDHPYPLGVNSYCEGEFSQTRNCSSPSELIPSFVWGTWSDWNEWTDCFCSNKVNDMSRRMRYCLSETCEGCPIEYRPCQQNCPIVKKYADWTNWIEQGVVRRRFRAVASSKYINDVNVDLKMDEETLNTVNNPWSRWDVRYGVAVRYRGSGNNTEIQHNLLSTLPRKCVDVKWLLTSNIASVIIGFISQFIISSCFQQFILVKQSKKFYSPISFV